MIKEYFLSNSDTRVGPLSEKDIVQGVRSGKISLFDLILNQQTNQWVMLLQHPDFSDIENASDEDSDSEQLVGLIADSNFTSPSINSKITAQDIPELEPVFWFLKNDPQTAYKFLQVLSLINNRKVLEHSLVGKNPKGPFRRLMEWEEFSEDSREIFKKTSNIHIPNLNLRRKHPRTPYGKNFLIHADGRLLRVFCTDISQSGISVLVRTDQFKNQEAVVIKFNDVLEDKNFDAKAVVISARRVRISGHEKPFLRYGIRFTHLTAAGRVFLAQRAGIAQSDLKAA